MIKQEKGITLIALSIAVIIILTITGMIVYSARDSIYIRNLTNMQNDIANLRDKVSSYYSQYGKLPAETEYTNTSNLSGVIGANDTGKFLIIELKLLDGLTLNYGQDYEKYKSGNYTNITDLTDIYIINENSNNIFYVEGIKVKQNDEIKMYYTDYTEADNTKVNVKTLDQWHTEEGEDGVTVITNGETKLKIGDYVNYDPTTDKTGNKITETKEDGTVQDRTYTSPAGTTTKGDGEREKGNGMGGQEFSISANTNGWRVLGLDENTNQILLISADTVKTTSNGYFYLKGQTGYQYGPDELNDICKMYGKGKGATGARSINIDDINKITKYDPTKTGNGTVYGAGKISEYGNEVTYTKNEGNISYVGTKNGNGANEDSKTSGLFRYYDQDYSIWKSLATTEKKIYTSTKYSYYPETLTTSKDGQPVGIKTNSKEYEMLFSRTSDGQDYWLASQYTITGAGYVYFGISKVSNGQVNTDSNNGLYISYEYTNMGYAGVRPVVSLEAGVSILGGDGIDRKFCKYSLENTIELNLKNFK